MNTKVEELNQAIKDKAFELGLIFVSGPDPVPVDELSPSYGTTNYQPRATFLFGVAEAN